MVKRKCEKGERRRIFDFRTEKVGFAKIKEVLDWRIKNQRMHGKGMPS